MASREYPRWKYHCSGSGCIVNNIEEEAQLGLGWSDAPGPGFDPDEYVVVRGPSGVSAVSKHSKGGKIGDTLNVRRPFHFGTVALPTQPIQLPIWTVIPEHRVKMFEVL